MNKGVAHAVHAEPDANRHAQKQRDIEFVKVMLPPFAYFRQQRQNSNAEKHHSERDKHPCRDNVFHIVDLFTVELFIVEVITKIILSNFYCKPS